MDFVEGLKKLEERRDRFARAVEEARRATVYAAPVLAATENLGLEARVSVDAYEWVGASWGEAKVYFEFKEQDSWNCALPLMELLEGLGFKANSWNSVDDAKNFARTFVSHQRYDGEAQTVVEVYVFITVLLKEGNTGGCRRVHVGRKVETKTTEVDEYKLVCEEEAA